MAAGFREEHIEGRGVDPLSLLPLLNESTKCLAQLARDFKQRGRPKFCEISLNRQADASQPSQNVTVASQRIDELAVDSRNGIQDIQCWVIAKHHGLFVRH
jgi:hypothetical protein